MTNFTKLLEIYSDPSFDELRNELFDKFIFKAYKEARGNGQMNLIQGPVAFGKTRGLYTKLAPYHFSKGGRLHIALSPMRDSQSFSEISMYVNNVAEYESNTQRPILHHVDNGIDLYEIEQQLEDGYNVTVVMTDQWLNKKERAVKFFERLVKKYDTLLTRDEASYGMLSTWEISKTILGHFYSDKTKQSFFNNFKRLFNAGAHSFGITATPTKEMMNSFIGQKWNIANEIPNNHELIPFRKWYKYLTLADWDDESYEDSSILPKELNGLFHSVAGANNRVKQFNESYKCSHIKNEKVTGLIVAQTKQGSKEKILISDIVDFIGTNDSFMSSDHTLIVVTGDGWEEYDSNGIKVNHGKNEQYQQMLNNSKHRAHYLVVMNKAIYGVNINTLGFGLIFRQYKNEDLDGDAITLTAEQLLGRFNRINVSRERIVYLLENYDVRAVYEYFQIDGIGCFSITAPRCKQFSTAFENFKKTHGTHIFDALHYLIHSDSSDD